MRFPLLLCVLCAVAGICWAEYGSVDSSLALGAAITAAAAGCGLAARPRTGAATVFILAGVLLLYSGIHQERKEEWQSSQIRDLVNDHGGRTPLFRIFATVDSQPVSTSRYFRIDVLVTAIKTPKGTVHPEERIRCYVHRKRGDTGTINVFPGQQIVFPARLQDPGGFNTPGVPSLNEIYARQRLMARASLSSQQLIEPLEIHWWAAPLALSTQLRQKVVTSVAEHDGFYASADTRQLAISFAAGERGLLSQEQLSLMRDSGLAHIIAISGLHVGVVASLLLLTTRLLPIGRPWSELLIILILLLYWMLTGMSVATTRATLLAIAWMISLLINRSGTSKNLLAMIALGILYLNPAEVFSAGFHLTFSATFAIIFVPDILCRLIPAAGSLPQIVLGTFSAQLVTIPLIMFHFKQVIPHALLANLVFIPLMSFAVGSAALYALLFSWIPFLNWFVMEMTLLFLTISTELLDAFSQLMPMPVRTSNMNVAWLLMIYGCILLIHVYFSAIGQRRLTIFIGAAICILLLIAATDYDSPAPPGPSVVFLDAGTADTAVVTLPSGQLMVVDTGGTPLGDLDIGEFVVSNYLSYIDRRHIDFLVLSHLDADHAEGTPAVLQNFSVGELWLPAQFTANDLAGEILAMAAKRNTPIRYFHRGQEADCGGAVAVFHNPPEEGFTGKDTANNNSLVFQLLFPRWQVVFTGDAENPVLEEIEKELITWLRPVVLKAPHHGSKDAYLPGFLDTLSPDLVVITASTFNVYGFPHPETIAGLRASGYPAYQTGRAGTVFLSESENRLELFTGRDLRKRSLQLALTGE